jgi:hypothetical protein
MLGVVAYKHFEINAGDASTSREGARLDKWEDIQVERASIAGRSALQYIIAEMRSTHVEEQADSEQKGMHRAEKVAPAQYPQISS